MQNMKLLFRSIEDLLPFCRYAAAAVIIGFVSMGRLQFFQFDKNPDTPVAQIKQPYQKRIPEQITPAIFTE